MSNPEPIQLYYFPTPNGHKITIALEEMNLPYEITVVDILKGDQFKPEFLAISPNNKMPAIVDPNGFDGQPISVFESGAILQYLGRKTGLFYPAAERERIEVEQWLMWQMGGFGPMLGQNHHFNHYAPQPVPYAIERYQVETKRLYTVLDKQLKKHAYVSGDEYSIADMAIYPWVVPHARQRIDLEDFPAVRNWFERISARPATKKAYSLSQD